MIVLLPVFDQQAVVRFQRISKHVPDQKVHFIIISLFICLFHRNIILIDQYNHFFAIMLPQKIRKFFQADGNNRKFPHIFFAQLCVSRNFQSVKQLFIASDLKKRISACSYSAIFQIALDG